MKGSQLIMSNKNQCYKLRVNFKQKVQFDLKNFTKPFATSAKVVNVRLHDIL